MNTRSSSPLQSRWKPVPGSSVLCSPGGTLTQVVGWGVIAATILFWLYLMFRFLFTEKPKYGGGDGAVLVLALFPIVFAVSWWMLSFSRRRILKELESISSKCGLQAYCEMTPPFWQLDNFSYRGARNGSSISIDFYSGKLFRLTLAIRGPAVDQIPDESFTQIIRKHNVELREMKRASGELRITVREHLFWDRAINWVSDTLELLSREKPPSTKEADLC